MTDDSVHLVRRTPLAEDIAAVAVKPVLHGDNGSALKASTALAMLDWLGVKPSHLRSLVSDGNAYVKSLFRAAKCRLEIPVEGFATLEAVREWRELTTMAPFSTALVAVRSVEPQSATTTSYGMSKERTVRCKAYSVAPRPCA
jgi:hypothetical protein